MKKLHVTADQRISSMSCGQRSQVALGLILAQNADLLVLDDFSLGLDPGYRRLFIEFLQEYVKGQDKTVFMTSHIIQDLERLVDDTIILDYGKILTQMPVAQLLDTFGRYTFTLPYEAKLPEGDGIYNASKLRDRCELYSFDNEDKIKQRLAADGLTPTDLRRETLSLEDAFIGLTGKY
jgi:ABC-2 type transport system ATP-binding protein